tara:strand:- start:201 stop:677 length:477 start_codon:yes stop_codon:yes gene_type:complete
MISDCLAERNYAFDRRVLGRYTTSLIKSLYSVSGSKVKFTQNATEMMIEAGIIDEDSVEEDGLFNHDLSIEYVICDQCRGSGTMTDPSIDCNGLDMDFDEFEELVSSGRYVEPCSMCTATPGREVIVRFPDNIQQWIEEMLDDAMSDYRTRCGEMGIY